MEQSSSVTPSKSHITDSTNTTNSQASTAKSVKSLKKQDNEVKAYNSE